MLITSRLKISRFLISDYHRTLPKTIQTQTKSSYFTILNLIVLQIQIQYSFKMKMTVNFPHKNKLLINQATHYLNNLKFLNLLLKMNFLNVLTNPRLNLSKSNKRVKRKTVLKENRSKKINKEGQIERNKKR